MKSEHGARSLAAPAQPENDSAEERAWCVDRGSTLAAMSTDELLRAISLGEISPASRVWCEGLEGWTRISDVPEIAQLFGFETELKSLPAVEIAPPSGFPAVAPQAPLELSHFDTPSAAPVARPVSSSEGIPFWGKGKTTPHASPRRFALARDAGWIGAGICVAAAAIGLALVQDPRSSNPALAYAENRLADVEAMALAAAAERRPVVDRTTLSRSEPGQRRLRGGAGRPSRR